MAILPYEIELGQIRCWGIVHYDYWVYCHIWSKYYVLIPSARGRNQPKKIADFNCYFMNESSTWLFDGRNTPSQMIFFPKNMLGKAQPMPSSGYVCELHNISMAMLMLCSSQKRQKMEWAVHIFGKKNSWEGVAQWHNVKFKLWRETIIWGIFRK